MNEIRKNGETSVRLRVTLYDSASPTGGGLTGLLFSTTGLIISTVCENEATATAYTAAGSTIETVTTLGTYAAPTATKCRFREVDATNHPGLYEIQLADARFAVSGARQLTISITAPGMVQQDYKVQLLAVDLYDTVRAGLTALPNAVAEASGGLITRGSGTGQLIVTSGLASANAVQLGGTAQTGRDIGASVLLSAGTGTGQLDFTSGVVKANVTQFGGSAGTFSGGRPNVNTTHWAGQGCAVNADGYPHVAVLYWRDGLVNGTQALQAWGTMTSVTSVGSGAITAASFAAGALTSAACADNFLTDAKVASDVTVKISEGTGTGQLNLSSGVVQAALTATGLDAISMADPGQNLPNTFSEYLLATCRRLLAPSKMYSDRIDMLGDDGVTVNLTQTLLDSSGIQSVGEINVGS